MADLYKESFVIKGKDTVRLELLHQVEQIVIDDGVMLPQGERNVHYLVDKDVKGLVNYYCGVNLDWIYADVEQ